MPKNIVEKLREYCQELEDFPECQKDWGFGASDFACSADLITPEEYKELLEEFGLIE